MKEITTCPLSSDKCEYKQNHICIRLDNPNLCGRCTAFRKKQRRNFLRNLKKYKVYRQPGCRI